MQNPKFRIMRRIISFILFAFLMTSLYAQEFEGIEGGDTEISFNGFVFTTVGTEYRTTTGNLFLAFGKYFTDKLLMGVAPGLTISSVAGQDEITTDFSGQIYLNYNFSSTRPAFPYIRLSYYQYSFDFEYQDFIDLAYVQGGLGYKAFLNANIAWDTTITYGLNLGTPEYGNLMLMTGISVIL